MGLNIQTITDIRKYVRDELLTLYPEEEIRSLSDIIIKTLFGADRLHRLREDEVIISNGQREKLIAVTSGLREGKPVQQILGHTIFYDCIIRVSEHTLIPRQETEELVDMIIKENKDYNGQIIDLGTGSGCIAIALAKSLKNSTVSAVDISDEALRIAETNAAENGVTVSFMKGDILVPDKITCKPAGIIVSNPPYVRESEKSLMHKNVLDYEPHMALFVPDYDPLRFYRAILEAAKKLLAPGGKIYFEINEALGEEMASLAKCYGIQDVTVIKDLNGKDRFLKGIKNG